MTPAATALAPRFTLSKLSFEGRDQTILEFSEPESQVQGIIAIDSLTLGPATGGCRLAAYPDRAAALRDARRLARGMSMKNAMAELPLGGGKSVIMLPGRDFDRARAFTCLALALNHLEGQYLAAEDVGTGVADMELIRKTSSYVFGLPRAAGLAGGNPSPRTADGVFLAILALLEYRGIDPAAARVAVQGLGSVGRALCLLLRERGVRLTVADVNPQAVADLAGLDGVTAVAANAIHRVSADVFAPCAMGAILNRESIPLLGARIIAGAANNQLAEPDDALLLMQRGILYAPDYVVNAGGIINVAAEFLGEDEATVTQRIARIPARLIDIVRVAEASGQPPCVLADLRANAKISGGAPAQDR